jgi:predicted transcriptional regulator
MLINIENKEFITTQTISKVDILEGTIQLNKSVRFAVRLMDSDDNVILSQNITIFGEEYENWGSDDNYIENLILTKLGVQKIQ